MRKVCIVIQSLLSRHPNHHPNYSKDREKHHTLLIMKLRQNVVYDVTNIKQHEQLGFDAGRPLNDMILKRTNSFAVVEGVLSCFFKATVSARTVGHVCQSHFVIQAEKGPRVPCESPGEREFGVVQEGRSWPPIPIQVNFLHRPADPIHERIRSGAQHRLLSLYILFCLSSWFFGGWCDCDGGWDEGCAGVAGSVGSAVGTAAILVVASVVVVDFAVASAAVLSIYFFFFEDRFLSPFWSPG